MASQFASLTRVQQRSLLEGPALKPPPGVIPNFVDPPNQTSLGFGLLFMCAGLSTLAVVIRLYAKIFCTKKVHIEDGLAVAALGVFYLFVYYSYHILHVVGGWVHQWDVPLKNMPMLPHDLNICSIAFGIAIMLLKVSIMMQWIHVFVPTGVRNAFFWTCHSMILVHILFYVALTIVELLPCKPRAQSGNRPFEGSCVDEYIVFVATGVVNIFSDVLILALPQKVIWKLRISTQKKFGISLIFAVGILACVCAVLRLLYCIRFSHTEDMTYAVIPMGIWAWSEITSGFLVLCMPSVPKAFRNTACIQKLISLVKTWMGFKDSQEMHNTCRYYFRSWHDFRARLRRPLENDFSDFSQSGLEATA